MSIQESLARLRTVAESLPEDDPDKLEMLTIEGNYTDLMEWALRKRNEHEANAEAMDNLMKLYERRRKSYAGKSDSMRGLILHIMTTANEKKFKGLHGTVSITTIAPKPIVTDETLVPEKYFKNERTLVKSLINDDFKNGEAIPGVSLDNGGQSCSIRS